MMPLVLNLRRHGGVTRPPDRVLMAILVLFGALALLVPDQAWRSAGFTIAALASVAPWLLLSVALAAGAAATGADHLVARAFQGREGVMVISAAAIGALSPFCSCGVIPLIAALLAMGTPLAPVMAFWLASPVMDPAMFALTVGTLGLPFAVGKALAAIGLGLLGGFGTLALTRRGWLAEPLRPGVGNGGCGGVRVRVPEPPVWTFWQDAARREKFRGTALSTLLFLGKWLALAFLLESLMLAYVPAEAVAGLLGGQGLWPILVATLVGVPAYLNGYAALPLVSGLMAQGMAPGAGMAFLVAGGVSSIPAAVAVWALATRAVFALYLGFALAGSLLAGLLFQALS